MNSISYISTRGHSESLTFSQAVVRGIAPDGGLYVPAKLPQIDLDGLATSNLNYAQLAYQVMAPFVDLDAQALTDCTQGAYDHKFTRPQIAPVVTKQNISFLELFHGKTLAFKDMALSILPRLMTAAIQKLGIKDEVVILTATSGDTGKAALEGFVDVPGTKIIVFYPTDGVSAVQKHQMVTQEGSNVLVLGIRGNFDDAQNGVKAIFTNQELNKRLKDHGYVFSSANSINIGRLVPQIVYYVSAWLQLRNSNVLQSRETFNVVVPTGNFGNILAAWYAKGLGVPINRFICASNSNKILTDFINTGTYDLQRPFYATISPSMDILISSNLERLIYELTGCDGKKTASFMADLKTKQQFSLDAAMHQAMSGFYGGYADDTATVNAIRLGYQKLNYVMDTHTAVAYKVLEDYRASSGDQRHAVIASTASPFKFTRSVVEGMGHRTDDYDDFQLIDILSQKAGLPVPEPIQGLKDRPVKHPGICQRDEMAKMVLDFLKI